MFVQECRQFGLESNVRGIYLFGSCAEECLRGNPERSFATDIDLLIIVNEKDPFTKLRFDDIFSKHYRVVHHPDMYSKRVGKTVEVTTLPVGSSYLANKRRGFLFGLSAFVFNRYFTLAGPENLADLVKLPGKEHNSSERLRIFLRCEWGINDLVTRIWPMLGQDVEVDYFRIMKLFLMDFLWVFSGEMDSDFESIKKKLLKSPSLSGSMLMYSEVSDIYSLFDKTIPPKELGVILFKNLVGIKKKTCRMETRSYLYKSNAE